jgi:hypothetical protein
MQSVCDPQVRPVDAAASSTEQPVCYQLASFGTVEGGLQSSPLFKGVQKGGGGGTGSNDGLFFALQPRAPIAEQPLASPPPPPVGLALCAHTAHTQQRWLRALRRLVAEACFRIYEVQSPASVRTELCRRSSRVAVLEIGEHVRVFELRRVEQTDYRGGAADSQSHGAADSQSSHGGDGSQSHGGDGSQSHGGGGSEDHRDFAIPVGRVRARVPHGWVSLSAASGQPLLRELPDELQPPMASPPAAILPPRTPGDGRRRLRSQRGAASEDNLLTQRHSAAAEGEGPAAVDLTPVRRKKAGHSRRALQESRFLSMPGETSSSPSTTAARIDYRRSSGSSPRGVKQLPSSSSSRLGARRTHSMDEIPEDTPSEGPRARRRLIR